MTLRIRQQYPWEWEFTFHTVLQCFCNLYYSTCFWAKWFARMKCCGQQVIFLHFADEWWWNIESTPRKKRMFVRWWWDDVREFERIVIKNVQYKTYNIYHMFYIHIILQYLHVYMIFADFIQQNLVQRLLNGVQICKILLRRKCWEPWQAKSSRSTFQWDWKIGSLGRTLPRGVQIMLCLVPPKSWWGVG